MKYLRRDFVGRRVIAGVLLVLFFVGVAAMAVAGKSSRKGYLGVSIERLSRSEKKELDLSHGVLVTHVVEDGPADEAGIVEDDVIQYFNGKEIQKPDDLVREVRETKPKTEVKIVVIREGEREELTVHVGRFRSRFYSYGWGGEDSVMTIIGGGGYLGVHLQELNEDLAGYFGVKKDEGALILEVEEGSPAEEAGLKAGDVIVQIDEEEIAEPGDARETLSDFEEGDEVEIVVVRQRRKQTFKAELDEYPYHSTIRVFKRLEENDCGKHMLFHFDLPLLEHIEIPEWDCDVDIRWDEGFGKRLERKLD